MAPPAVGFAPAAADTVAQSPRPSPAGPRAPLLPHRPLHPHTSLHKNTRTAALRGRRALSLSAKTSSDGSDNVVPHLACSPAGPSAKGRGVFSLFPGLAPRLPGGAPLLRSSTQGASLAGSLVPALALGGDGGDGGVPIDSGGGGGGGGGAHNPAVADLAEASVAVGQEEVLLFDVSGMMCGGCVSSVKRILEGHSNVNSATVNLTTETALVRVFLDAKYADLDTLASALAKELAECGFTAKRTKSKKRIKAAQGA